MVHVASLLKVNRGLAEISIRKHGVTDFGCARLCDALKLNRTLKSLDLGCNSIGQDGCKDIHMMLSENFTLERLELHANRIEDPGVAELAKALSWKNSTLAYIGISNNNVGAKGMSAFAGIFANNEAIKGFRCWGNPGIASVTSYLSTRSENLSTKILPLSTDACAVGWRLGPGCAAGTLFGVFL